MIARNTPDPGATILAAVRTPILEPGRAHAGSLAADVLRESLYRAAWPPGRVDEVLFTGPAGRSAALDTAILPGVPVFTLHRSAASGLDLLGHAVTRIAAGRRRVIHAAAAHRGPAPPARRRFRAAPPPRPRLTDAPAERAAHQMNVTRLEQDAFALRSHRLAGEADRAGWTQPERVPLFLGPDFEPALNDTQPRPGQSSDALAMLTPILDPRDGTITLGNRAADADGAAAVLLADNRFAAAEGLDVHSPGRVRGYAAVAVDPELGGLAPVFAIDRLLRASGLGAVDVALWEVQELSAAAVLACTRAMASARWCRRNLDRPGALIDLDPDRLNPRGGAIALGHPGGAGALCSVVSLLDELRRRDTDWGIVATAAAHGQAAALLLEHR